MPAKVIFVHDDPEFIERAAAALSAGWAQALARMARVKRPAIKVVFTAAAENVEYTEGIGEAVTAAPSICLSSSLRLLRYPQTELRVRRLV
jgi:hypothetical protein